MNSIYVFEGKDQKIAGEKFNIDYSGKVQLYVWRSAEGTLGFNSPEAVPFLQLLTTESSTLQFPDPELLNHAGDTLKIFKKMNSVTLFNAENLLFEEYDRFLNYQKQMNKNLLLQRFNKPVQELVLPELLTWYDRENKHYTQHLMDFAVLNNLKFIVWGFSEFGNYFWSMDDVWELVKIAADKECVVVKQVSKMSDMPYH